MNPRIMDLLRRKDGNGINYTGTISTPIEDTCFTYTCTPGTDTDTGTRTICRRKLSANYC